MKKTYLKIIVKEIKQSFGRFLAIFSIVVLGVGLLSGLTVTTPDMHYSVDTYYDTNNMADIFIKATMGLTDEDIEVLSGMDDINQIMPAYVNDVLLENEKKELIATRVFGLPLLGENAGIEINQLELIEGRMPEANNECLVEREGGFLSEIPIGSKIILSKENTNYNDLEDMYAVKEYTVVGVVSNSFYFSKEREITTVGNGILSSIIYVDNTSYDLDVYTDVYITASGFSGLNTFSGEYEKGIETLVEKLEDTGKVRSDIRYDEVVAEALDELNDGKKEYFDAKLEAEKELADAYLEIQEGKVELADALIELEDGKRELADAKKTLQEETIKAEKEITDARQKLADALIELEDGEKELADGFVELQDGEKEYKDGYQTYLDGKKDLEEAQEKFNEGEEAYLDGRAELSSGKRQLREGERELEEARKQLSAAEAEYNTELAKFTEGKEEFQTSIEPIRLGLNSAGFNFSSTDELFNAVENDPIVKIAFEGVVSGSGITVDMLENNWKQIKGGEANLVAAKVQIDGGKRQLAEGSVALSAGWSEISSGERELEKARVELEENRGKLADAWAELEEGRLELEDAKKKIEEGYIDLANGRKELDDGRVKYQDGVKELSEAELEFREEIAKANREIADAEKDLKEGLEKYYDGEKELAEGEEEYLEGKADAEKELADAWQEILDGEKEIEDLETPKWYVLDRNQNMSYVSFIMNSEKVEAVAKVFPGFFYLIAALVALTTMTRMVEEERTQIGTLKALGYSKSTIIFKYLFYCGLASVLGSLVGLFIGFKLLPPIIWNAFSTLYHLPKFYAPFNTGIGVVSSSLAVLSTMLATFYACYQALKEKPSILMLPRVPKAGKRILLENIGFIWSKMSFNHKATARNLFRYKKHFFMTVIGIGGCTALLIAGFGLRDSISDVGEIQYSEIFNYDILIDLDTKKELDATVTNILNNESQTKKYMELFVDKGYGSANGEKLEASIYVAESLDRLNEFIKIRERKSKKEIGLEENSLIITEKLSETLDLQIGDKISLENSDEEVNEFIITGITEQYLGNNVYISSKQYKKYFTKDTISNTILVDTHELTLEEQDDMISDLLSSDGVLSGEFIAQTKRTFDNLLASINYIVVVIIIASGALAFIVLYNLTNININERKKELATLKVLGFHNEEVSAYIFRETAILTIIGIIAGLLLGELFHSFIINTIESTSYMFGREVKLLSFALSAIITVIFSLIVNIFMSKKLKNIQMVDSMKAID